MSAVSPLNKIIFYDDGVKQKDSIRRCSFVRSSVPVSSLDAVVDSISKENIEYSMLMFSGHGSPGHQGVGSGNCESYRKNRDIHYLHVSDWAEKLSRVASYLIHEDCPVPIVFFAGCEVGKMPKRSDFTLPQLASRIVPNVLFVATLHINEILVLPSDDDEEEPNQIGVVRVENNRVSAKPLRFNMCLNNMQIANSRELAENNCLSYKRIEQECTYWGDFSEASGQLEQNKVDKCSSCNVIADEKSNNAIQNNKELQSMRQRKRLPASNIKSR